MDRLYDILKIKSINESAELLANTNYIANTWAKPYIATLYEKDIIYEIPGYEDLNDNITRIEAMDLLSKLLKEVENVEIVNLDEFKDSKEIKKYEELLKEDVEIANIIKGYDDKTLRPNKNMTRIEALTLIINGLEKLGW
ncbi:MAG: S-layer homology domain-containing protein [Tissierellia bacterium]|nr:S-layer homology domain-containing protein [Tissierellia bacterium]